VRGSSGSGVRPDALARALAERDGGMSRRDVVGGGVRIAAGVAASSVLWGLAEDAAARTATGCQQRSSLRRQRQLCRVPRRERLPGAGRVSGGDVHGTRVRYDECFLRNRMLHGVCSGNPCVQCVDPSQCPAGNQCETAVCTGNMCGFNFQPAGAACAGGVCDGAGHCAACQASGQPCLGNSDCRTGICVTSVCQ
jgi:hypothetical protein